MRAIIPSIGIHCFWPAYPSAECSTTTIPEEFLWSCSCFCYDTNSLCRCVNKIQPGLWFMSFWGLASHFLVVIPTKFYHFVLCGREPDRVLSLDFSEFSLVWTFSLLIMAGNCEWRRCHAVWALEITLSWKLKTSEASHGPLCSSWTRYFLLRSICWTFGSVPHEVTFTTKTNLSC